MTTELFVGQNYELETELKRSSLVSGRWHSRRNIANYWRLFAVYAERYLSRPIAHGILTIVEEQTCSNIGRRVTMRHELASNTTLQARWHRIQTGIKIHPEDGAIYTPEVADPPKSSKPFTFSLFFFYSSISAMQTEFN
jgi:hypothetical protein